MIGLAIVFVLVVIVAPIASLIWVWKLSGRVADLKAQLVRLEEMPRGVPGGAPAPAVEISEATVIKEDRRDDLPKAADIEPVWPEDSQQAAVSQKMHDKIADRRSPEKLAWEERLASSWMVWLGGVTLALAAVFLFRYAIDQGYLTPLTRVILGLVGGGALLSAGEWAQRSSAKIGELVSVRTDYVPPALSSAGIFAILASLFSAHALYGLIGPGTAFLTMGITAYVSLGLALRQGWFVALLGILAGYVMPYLIATPDPNAVAMFVYLFVLTLGALALMVWRDWPWFAYLTIVGALGWPCLWALEDWGQSDQLTVGVYVLGIGAAFGILSTRLPVKAGTPDVWKWVMSAVVQSSGLGFVMGGVVLVVLGAMADFNAAAFVFLSAYVAMALALGVWRTSLESLAVVAALVVLVALLIWPQPFGVSLPEPVQAAGAGPVSNAFGPFVMPPEFHAFSRALWAFAALFGVGAFLSLSRVLAKPAWAGLSAFMPVALYAIGYWRIGAFEVDVNWAYWALGLSGVLFLAAMSVRRNLPEGDRDVPLAFYAAGTTAAIALIFTCLLREAWLTVALGVEVAAIAWIWSMLKVRELKPIAIVLLAVVVIRLVANPQLLDYQGSVLGMFAWVTYGYGIPALASYYAARTFAKDGRDLTVTLREIAGIGFAGLMVVFQLKIWTSGAIETGRWDLLDTAVQSIWWIIAGGLLLYRPFSDERKWAQAAGMAVLAASAFLVVAGSLMANNPLFSDHIVGTWPIINLLSVAFLLPAISFGLLAASKHFDIPVGVRKLMAAGAGVLVFIDLTLEVRRAFWGNAMELTPASLPGNGELYAYSAAWIIFALVLLTFGIWRQSQALRYASLAVLMLTVAKVFIYDMSDLTGLFRVASFLGLGLTLIGIGRVYQRFVFSREALAEDT